MAAGHLVSGYVKQHLPIMLVNHLSMENDASKALTKGQSCFLLGSVTLSVRVSHAFCLGSLGVKAQFFTFSANQEIKPTGMEEYTYLIFYLL